MRQYRQRRKDNRLWLEACNCLNAVLIIIPFAFTWWFYYARKIPVPFSKEGDMAVLAIFLMFYVSFGITFSGFKINLPHRVDILYSQALAIGFSNVLIYLVIFLLMRRLPAPWPLLVAVFFEVTLAWFWIVIVHRRYFATTPADETVVIWDMRQGMDKLVDSYDLSIRFHIIRTVHVKECLQDIGAALDGAQSVFLCGIHSHDRNQITKYCIFEGIRVYVIPRVGDVIMSGASSVHMFHLPILLVERYTPSPFYLFVKRGSDIVLSVLALIVLSPFMLVAAVCIHADGGPVFYKQKRLTKDGMIFTMYKFRSMVVDAEKNGIPALSRGRDDPRVTRVGKAMRACRFDEVPQLWNVVKGDMSLVGPRPERPEIAALYEKEMPEFYLRLQTKAGLTGLAQIYGKYNTMPYDKLLMDLKYIASASITQDLRILFATVKILFMPESTEGVAFDSERENEP